MKRIIGKIIALSFCLILACSFMFSGCDLMDLVIERPEEIIEEQNNESNYNQTGTETALIDSTGLIDKIKFGSSQSESFEYVADAIEQTKVNRATVAIVIAVQDAFISGSGVIIDIDDGVNFGADEGKIFYIVTCHHVISKCEGVENSVSVYVPDAEGDNGDDLAYNSAYKFTGKIGGEISKTSPVSLVGGDKETDIAVLRLYVEDPQIAKNIVKAKVLSENSSVRLGEEVFAIGNAEGEHYGWTTKGVISDVITQQYFDEVGNLTLIGINADIYPGNSGGGLFNMKGELIGVTNGGETISINDKDTSIGINYAIMHKNNSEIKADTGFINVVKQLIGTYIKSDGHNYGYISYHREKMGFTASVLSAGVVTVTDIVSGSQAEANGLKINDVIQSIKLNSGAEKAVTANEDLSNVIESSKLGDTVTITVKRNRVTHVAKFTVRQAYFCNTEVYTNILAS